MPAAEVVVDAASEPAVRQVGELLAAPWFPPVIDRRFLDFVVAEGRVPRLGDPKPPSAYRGFLLFQVLLLSGSEGIHDRWIYYFETLAAGRILDRPIPPLRFAAPSQAKGGTLARLRKLVEKLGRDHGYGERALNTLIEWTAFGLGVCDARPDVSEKTDRFLYEQFDVADLLTHPYDWFGHLLEEERGHSRRFQGFFLTHDRVCELMAELALGGYAGDVRRARIHEPAVGSARQLLQASNYSLALTGADIDPVCTVVSLINGALYCPHLAFPYPPHILESTHETVASPAAAPTTPAEQRRHVAHVSPAAETTRGAQPTTAKQSSLFDF